VHFSIRHGDKADSTFILTALGVDQAGNKEVLARLSLRAMWTRMDVLASSKTCGDVQPPTSI
jgi:hypothetical protein